MNLQMEAGITGTQTITVTEDKTAQAMGSGTLPVFATPAMIALMENTAYKKVWRMNWKREQERSVR